MKLWKLKSLQAFEEGYSLRKFKGDFLSGVLVGMSGLPLYVCLGVGSLAACTEAGINPSLAGVVTAIIAGVIMACFGGTQIQIAGPATLLVPCAAAIGATYGFSGLWFACVLAGLFLVILSFLGAAQFTRFIPMVAVKGVVLSLAILLGVQQLRILLGTGDTSGVSGNLVTEFIALAQVIPQVHAPTVILSLVCLLSLFLIPEKWNPRLFLIVFFTFGLYLFGFTNRFAEDGGIATVASAFGLGPTSIQPDSLFGDAFKLRFPDALSWEIFRGILPWSMVLAFLVALQSTLASRDSEGDGVDEDAKLQMSSLGGVNFVIPMLGGVPASSSLTRTRSMREHDATTPVASLVHATFLMIILLLGAPLGAFLPMALVAVILLHLAVTVPSLYGIDEIKRMSKGELSVFIATTAICLLVDLQAGVAFGLAVGAISLVQQVGHISEVKEVPVDEAHGFSSSVLKSDILGTQLTVVEARGVMFHATADRILHTVKESMKHRVATRVVLLKIPHLLAMDSHAAGVLEKLHWYLRKKQCFLLFVEAEPEMEKLLLKYLGKIIDEESVCPTLHLAVSRARELVKRPTDELF